MRGQLYSLWYKEEHGDCFIYWQLVIPKWMLLWIFYVLYCVLDAMLFGWFFRKIGVLRPKKSLYWIMAEHPSLWAVPFAIEKEDDREFDYRLYVRNKYKTRDWNTFAAWKGFGIGPFTI